MLAPMPVGARPLRIMYPASLTVGGAERQMILLAERLPRGPHILEISGRGPQGDAFWAVPVTVLDGS